MFSESIFSVSGVVFSLVGLYLYHQQYLCYEYTPLLFILGAVVCLGGALLSVPTVRKKKPLSAVITALIMAVVLMGGMFLINAVIGNGELNLIALIIPVYLTFIITTVLSFICVLRIFGKKVIKAVLALYNSPWQSEMWQNAYSEYKTMTDDI